MQIEGTPFSLIPTGVPIHHIKSYFEGPGSDGKFVRLGDNVLKNNKNKLELNSQ